MKVTCRKLCMLPMLSVFAALVLLPTYSDPASAQSQPPCCNDRWNPEWTQREMWGPGMMNRGQRQRMTRHWTFMHSSIPQEYLNVRNPFVLKPDVVREGGELYRQKCSTCHGAQGMGDGEIANSLNPSPALLAYMIQMPMAVDEYLLWSISEGEKPLELLCQHIKASYHGMICGRLSLLCEQGSLQIRKALRNS